MAKRIMLTVDQVRFFEAAQKLDRGTIGDRMIELMLGPESTSLQVALHSVYGITVWSVEDAPKEATNGE